MNKQARTVGVEPDCRRFHRLRWFFVGECQVPHKKVPYYLSWISKYHAFVKGGTQDESEHNEIERFI